MGSFWSNIDETISALSLANIIYITALICTVLATFICILHMHRHFLCVSNDPLRKHTIRILIMIPFYSIESLLSLYFKHYPGANVFRESYESVVIWSTYGLLITLLGGDGSVKRILDTRFYSICDGGMAGFRMQFQHPIWTRFCLRPIHSPSDFLAFCKVGILQYVPLKILTSITMFICEQYHVWHDGEFRVDSGYLWCAIINNFSQILAIYSLLLFWSGFKNELTQFRPALKLFCIKGVVFFSWWQSVFISIIASRGYIVGTSTHTAEQLAMGLQDFLICIEMLGFSICHLYAFPVTDENFIEVHGDETRLINLEDSRSESSDVPSRGSPIIIKETSKKNMKKIPVLKEGSVRKQDKQLKMDPSTVLPASLVVRTNNNAIEDVQSVPRGETNTSGNNSHFDKVISAFNPKDIVMDVRDAFFAGQKNSVLKINFNKSSEETSVPKLISRSSSPAPDARIIVESIQPSSTSYKKI